MVHFHQRALRLGGSGTGALWVSEGLAQMAEELVARRYADAGEAELAEQFRNGNRIRARRYLEDPSAVSLVIASGQGTLEERGGGWLFILYLADRWGEGVLGSMTATTRTGVDNVTAVTGAPWPSLLADWWSALALAGEGGYGFAYPGVPLPTLLSEGDASWPLEPRRPGSGDFLLADTLWSASAAHYIVETPAGTPVVLRLGGEAGSGTPSGSGLRLRVVRLF